MGGPGEAAGTRYPPPNPSDSPGGNQFQPIPAKPMLTILSIIRRIGAITIGYAESSYAEDSGEKDHRSSGPRSSATSSTTSGACSRRAGWSRPSTGSGPRTPIPTAPSRASSGKAVVSSWAQGSGSRSPAPRPASATRRSCSRRSAPRSPTARSRASSTTSSSTSPHRRGASRRPSRTSRSSPSWTWRFVYGFLPAPVRAEIQARSQKLPPHRGGPRHHQRLTAGAREVLTAHLIRLTTVVRQSATVEDFHMRFGAEFRGGPLQLSFPAPSAGRSN